MNLEKKLQNLSQKSILAVGLDVAKAKIDICIQAENKSITFQVQNKKPQIQSMINTLASVEGIESIPFIIESTGDYHLLASMLLSDAGLSLKEINPIITNQYIKASIRGTKTDKTDAGLLAKIGIIQGDKLPTFSRTKEVVSLGKKISLIESLEKQIQSLRMSLKNHKETNENLGFETSAIVTKIEELIDDLQKQIKKLQDEVTAFKMSDEATTDIAIINSIVGISPYMAKIFYVKFAHKEFHSKEAMYAFVGYDPRLKNSGTFQGKARISKRGNSYIRKKLFQSAFCSIQHCELFKDIYNRLKAKGKHHYVCLNAITKKMIHIIRSMLKNKTSFNPNFAT